MKSRSRMEYVFHLFCLLLNSSRFSFLIQSVSLLSMNNNCITGIWCTQAVQQVQGKGSIVFNKWLKKCDEKSHLQCAHSCQAGVSLEKKKKKKKKKTMEVKQVALCIIVFKPIKKHLSTRCVQNPYQSVLICETNIKIMVIWTLARHLLIIIRFAGVKFNQGL